jgi:RES domain-containing protein
LRFRGTCYRAHDPRWAFTPLSGDGARLHGGRFNRIGTPALYLSLSLSGMFAEMSHGFAHRFPPLMVITYEVDVDDIVDLRIQSRRRRARVALKNLACAWELDHSNGVEPASWRIADRLIREGAAGILVPSFATHATQQMRNLVLWRWGSELPHRVQVYDPGDRLPRDQSSWK